MIVAEERGQRRPGSTDREVGISMSLFLTGLCLGLVDLGLIQRGGVGFVHPLNVIDDPFLQELHNSCRFWRRNRLILLELFDARDESPMRVAVRGQFNIGPSRFASIVNRTAALLPSRSCTGSKAGIAPLARHECR